MKLKQEEHDKVIQYMKSNVPKDSNDIDGIEIDAGGGLKQMMIHKKSDDEETATKDANAVSTDERISRLESLVEMLMERLDLTELSHDEVLLLISQLDENGKGKKRRKKRRKKHKKAKNSEKELTDKTETRQYKQKEKEHKKAHNHEKELLFRKSDDC